MRGIKVIGTGHYIPSTKVTNDDLSTVMDTNDEWIKTRTGIETRFFAKDENTSQLAYKAAIKALENANCDIKDIDIIICATMTADDYTPSTACKLLKYFDCPNIMAFDVNAACSGFVYALNTAAALLNYNNKKKALVVGCEKISKILDFTDRSTAILFGDGAGATVVELADENTYFYCMAKPDKDDVLYANSVKGSTGLFENSTCDDFYLKMNGQEVFRFAVSSIEDAIKNILETANLTIDDIDYIIPHQANIRIINSVARKLSLDHEKIFVNLNHYGNTSAASIPIALSEAMMQNKIKKGDKVLLVGFGAGLSWASSIITL